MQLLQQEQQRILLKDKTYLQNITHLIPENLSQTIFHERQEKIQLNGQRIDSDLKVKLKDIKG